MSNTTTEVLTVEAVNQYGFKSGGKNYSISTMLAKKGITPQSFVPGMQIQAEIWTGPQGGKKVNNFTPVTGGISGGPTNVYIPPATPPMPPALPVTTVANTPAPGGVPPVSKAPRSSAASSDEKMTRADWEKKDQAIELVAIIKSSIESPALGEHVTGKSTAEFLELTRQFIQHNIETLRLAKGGSL